MWTSSLAHSIRRIEYMYYGRDGHTNLAYQRYKITRENFSMKITWEYFTWKCFDKNGLTTRDGRLWYLENVYIIPEGMNSSLEV